MPELTDAQYLAACRALLGMGPDVAFSDEFTLGVISDVCPPGRLKAALAVAFEAGRESAHSDHEVTHEWGTRFLYADREGFISSAGELEDLARHRAGYELASSTGAEVVRRVRLTGPWEAQP